MRPQPYVTEAEVPPHHSSRSCEGQWGTVSEERGRHGLQRGWARTGKEKGGLGTFWVGAWCPDPQAARAKNRHSLCPSTPTTRAKGRKRDHQPGQSPLSLLWSSPLPSEALLPAKAPPSPPAKMSPIHQLEGSGNYNVLKCLPPRPVSVPEFLPLESAGSDFLRECSLR